MTKIVAAKFYQNEEILQILKDTEGPLYEATTDDYWGIGYSLRSKEALTGKSTGTNKLGQILVALRQSLLDGLSGSDTNSEHGSATRSCI